MHSMNRLRRVQFEEHAMGRQLDSTRMDSRTEHSHFGKINPTASIFTAVLRTENIKIDDLSQTPLNKSRNATSLFETTC